MLPFSSKPAHKVRSQASPFIGLIDPRKCARQLAPSRAESVVVVAVAVVMRTRRQAALSRIFYLSVYCGVVMVCWVVVRR